MSDGMALDESASAVAKKTLKRKRENQSNNEASMMSEEGESRVKTLNEELECLFKYFDQMLNLGLGFGSDPANNLNHLSVNSMIAVLLEEKRCSYSKLVAEIYERVKERDGGATVASVRISVLNVGQRVAYGIPNADVDVLEDESESCLWCWETRDMKLLPNTLRGLLKIRRICRKKINERISAILDVRSLLQKPDDRPSYKHDITKAADKLNKVLAEADIRLLVDSMAQKIDSEIGVKEVKKKGTTIVKEMEKNKRDAEKEKKRMDRALQREKLQSEKEKKRLQQEAERDMKRREKEESEMRKQLKRKQEEADKEQCRRAKEDAEVKKQLSAQKQASIMERFLKKCKTTVTLQKAQSPQSAAANSNDDMRGSMPESVSVMMDSALQHTNDIDVEEIQKSHMTSWRCLGHSIRSNNKQHWGIRRKPKAELIKELKLTTNKGPARDDDMCVDVDLWEGTNTDDKSCHENTSISSPSMSKSIQRKQLLQFAKSYRPAFYGIWPEKSCVVRPRQPLKKDPNLEYDIDSDEEWEEEDPGESLSDSDKEVEEKLDEGSLKVDDEEESEDEFFVPDGYLSENEGVDTDRTESNLGAEVNQSSPCCKPEAESGENSVWVRQQKYIYNFTEHALRQNHPLIIVNLMHEKAPLLSAEDLMGTQKIEQMCLQALSICAFPGGVLVEVPSNNNLQEENQEVCASTGKSTSPGIGVSATVLDSDLPDFVSVIRSCPQNINKLLEALQKRFPDSPKSQLRNKVREISDYHSVDGRWKVKKGILEKLGMSPDKTGRMTKNIATFFSKRCLPPAGQAVHPCESSPESIQPGSSSHPQPQQCTDNV